MNLLIVDDEYYTVESISNKIRTLRPDFFEIFCAYNLTQALEIFSTHPIDLRFRPRTAGPDPSGTLRNGLYFSDRLCKI